MRTPGAPRDTFGAVFNMGGGQSGTSVAQQNSDVPAWKQPYVTQGYNSALANLSNPQQYYPGQTVVPFSAQTENALTGIENKATAGSPLLGASQDNLLATLRGDFLDPTTNPAFQKASQGIQAQVGSMFNGAGRYGSGAMANQGREALTDLAAKTYLGERQNQMTGLSLAPTINNLGYSDLERLAQVGATREGKAGAELQDQISRWNFAQQEPSNALARYMQIIAGGSGGQTTTTTSPIYSNPLATGLGSAAALASIYSAFK